MTFFLSGIYLLPEAKKNLYRPPNNRVGASDIGYLTDDHIKDTLKYVRQAWLEGHEIGTHFNGHFCGGSGSVGNWTPAQWQNEIDQAVRFVTEWKTNSGWTELDPLPFDYSKELVGGRTPASSARTTCCPPPAAGLALRRQLARRPPDLARQAPGDLGPPLQAVPFPGHSFEVLSMDYNMLANQSKNSTNGMPSRYPGWRKQAAEAYLSGFTRAYETNRAPFFIGNHFEQWNGGIYMDAVEEALKEWPGRRTSGSSPSGSSWTGSTSRTRRCSPSCAAWAWGEARRRLEGLPQGRLTVPVGTPRLGILDKVLYGHVGGAQDPPNAHAKLFT